MSNYISINDKQIPLTDEQVKQIVDAYKKDQILLSDIPVGETIRIGDHEFIVLEQSGDTTALIRMELLPTKEKFGSSNNYDGSYVDKICGKFAEDLVCVVGERNLVLHTVNLTSDDGLKDYGKIQRRVSLLTTDLYRRYVEVLDKFKPDAWWWFATPFSTKRHDNDLWVKCVSPSGCIISNHYDIGEYGVRPFCILKSDIFVSR